MAGSSGVNFPSDPKNPTGPRPTTDLNKGAFVAAVAKQDAKLAEEITKVKNWRFGYSSHVLKQTELACKSYDTALNIANDGLDYLHTTMVFERDGKELPVREAMAKYFSTKSDKLFTAIVKGEKKQTSPIGLEVPYGGKVLRGN
ncbi:unnamed protein product, partial [Amoebophrya sp. A120]|eukprot:GSA120T00016020001.1